MIRICLSSSSRNNKSFKTRSGTVSHILSQQHHQHNRHQPPHYEFDWQQRRLFQTSALTASTTSLSLLSRPSSSLLSSPRFHVVTSIRTVHASFPSWSDHHDNNNSAATAASVSKSPSPPPPPSSASSSSSSPSTPPPSSSYSIAKPEDKYRYMTRDGIPLKLPDRQVENKFLEQQQAVRLLYDQARYQKALDLSQQLYLDMVAHYGTRYHPGIASTQNNIGLMYKSLGHWEQARHYYQQAMMIYAKVVGDDHASYAAALHNVALLNKLQVQMERINNSTAADEEGEEGDGEKGESASRGEEEGTGSSSEEEGEETSSPNAIAQKHQELLDEAVECLQRAWKIRQQELGMEHPKTIESRSSLGSTLAYQILFYHDREEEEATAAAASTNNSNNNRNNKHKNKKNNSNKNSQDKVKMKKITSQQWEVAEDHLRESFKMALANAARQNNATSSTSNTTTTNADGQGNTPSWTFSSSATTATSSSSSIEEEEEEKSEHPEVVVTTTTPKGSSTNSNATTSASTSSSSSSSSSSATTTTASLTTSTITTLAAATAAQNLAVCLKYRATMSSVSTGKLHPKKQQLLLHQARELYQQALAARLALLGDEFHPQVVMSKHSLAECLDAMGDKATANQLRMEMLDAYDRHVLKRKQEEEQEEKEKNSKKK